MTHALIKRSATAVALLTATGLAGTAHAQRTQTSADGRWTAQSEIVAQTSTGTVASGGNPIYIPAAGTYTGTVGLLMNYGAAGSFVCSGSLINRNTIVTAAHCVSDGTSARPLSTTAFFYNGGPDDAVVYAGGPNVTQIGVTRTVVNSAYTGQVVDENDIAVLTLGQLAPDFARAYQLSSLTDLTSIDHTITGYGARSIDGGTQGTSTGFAAGTGRRRFADNRFDFKFGDDDFEGYFDNGFGGASVENVWVSDFDNGTAFRDNSCNLASFEAASAPAIFNKPVFSTGKYCNLGRGEREGIGAGGDSGTGYFVDGKLAAVHSFALWYRADESANRFGQFKGAVSVDFHRDFIAANVPEPATWALMIAGFGLAGGAMRRSRRVNVSFA